MPSQTLLLRYLVALAAPLLVQSATVFASSYSGELHTLSFTSGNHVSNDLALGTDAASSSHKLRLLHSSGACGPSPSWLTLDSKTTPQTLYCVNEGVSAPNGSISSFSINPKSAALTHRDSSTTLPGPVNAAIYGHGDAKEVLLAHYAAPGSLSSFSADPPAKNLKLYSERSFQLTKPGADPSRQEASHAHEVILDPTGEFILVPDLGADLVRVFKHGSQKGQLTKLDPLHAPAGSGPRHAAFWSPSGSLASFTPGKDKLFLFVVSELANTVSSYSVTYAAKGAGLKFKQIQKSSPYGGRKATPSGAAVAEVAVDPSNKFLYVSNRYDRSFDNGASDSLSQFKILDSGRFDFVRLAAAGGLTPRNFEINKKGDFVAVGLQDSDRVVVLSRDVKTGKIGGQVAEVDGLGPVTSVKWFE